MNNPRRRNQLVEAKATSASRMPSVPDLTNADQRLVEFARTVKSILDTRTGASNPMEQWVTQRMLHELGLAGGEIERSAPTDALGVPLLTSRGRLSYVSFQALADVLSAYLSSTDAPVPDTAVDELRRRVAEVRPGMSPVQVHRTIAHAIDSLRTELEDKLDDATKSGKRAQDDIARQALSVGDTERTRTIEVTIARRVWTITHGLKRYPIVTVINDAGEKVEPRIKHNSISEVVISHGRPMIGIVLLK